MAIDIDHYYRRYGPMVYRRCRYLLGDEEEAMDAMQDTFVKVLRYRNRLDTRGPSSLLYTIATNVCLNRLRSRKKNSAVQSDLERIAGADDHTEQTLSKHFLERLFEHQKSDTRTIAVLHYLDGMTLHETATVVGMSVSGVRKRLRTLRSRGLVLRER